MMFASAAPGGFTFAAINAADVPGLSTAIIAQLTVFANHIDARLNDLMREPDISGPGGTWQRNQGVP